MSLLQDRHKKELRDAGWRSRGYLPHFDGQACPQFQTLHLADSIPTKVIEGWKRELGGECDKQKQTILHRRIQKYLDQGYGHCFLRDGRIARIVQDSLLKFDGLRYTLFAWVIMPNHSHYLLTRFEDYELKTLMHSHKSYTAHEANKVLRRSGQFWQEEYYDRFIRNAQHFRNVVSYISKIIL